MKKIFSFIVGLLAVASLQAVNYTDAARITMSCAGGSETQLLDLIVDADQATPATEPNLASLYEVGQVNLYANYNNGNISSFTANAIRNLPVVIVTNRRDVSYTFTFNVPLSTQGLVLTDLRSSEGVKNITMTNGDSYTFSVASEAAYEANKNITIADRFIINYLPVSIKGTGDWWGLGKDVDLAISADLQTATGSLTFDAAGTYNFKVVRGTDWLSDVAEFTRNDNERAITATEDGGMWFTIDAIGASNEYAFTWTFATNTLTIDFPAAPAPAYAAEVTTNEYGLATFSHASDLAPVEAGVKLYKGAVSGETLALTQVADIAAEQGVIVYGEANTTYHFNVINGATADFAGNELLAASAWNATHTGYDIYVLSGNALYLYEGTDFPANKAFLKIAQSATPSPRRIRLVFDQATAIDNISADNVKAEKVVENGQILIRRGNEVYNLQGQIVK